MKPGHYDLPIIWRGSTYTAIIFTWLDTAGNPINLTGWTPRARSLNIDFNPQIVSATAGTTSISFSKEETANMKLGVEEWDWVFESVLGQRSGPLLSGFVTIKDPATMTAMERSGVNLPTV